MVNESANQPPPMTNLDRMQLEPIEQSTVTEIVAQRLMDLLSEGILRPGDKLPPERELAEQLRVGRATVREALKLLTLSGILEAKRGYGTYVRQNFRDFLSQHIQWPVLLSSREINMIVEVRESLEVKAARLAAMRATSEEMEALTVFRKMQQIGERNVELETDLDMQFHNAIAAAAHNDLLSHLMLSLEGSMRQYVALASELTDWLETVVIEHQAIYDAVIARDPDEAEQAMIRHLSSGKADILRYFNARADSSAPVESIGHG